MKKSMKKPMEKLMKDSGRCRRALQALKPYRPWLFALLGSNALASILLWLSDAEAFRALLFLLVALTILTFTVVSALLIRRERQKDAALCAFLTSPDLRHEEELLRLMGGAHASLIRDLGQLLRRQEATIRESRTLLEDYENYVETWAHEIKLPLSLLTLMLDNEKEALPEALSRKLETVRQQMQENISQILYYYRVRSEKRDFLLASFDVGNCVEEVLEDFGSILDEKRFTVHCENLHAAIYTDRRSFSFMVTQIISNAVKYSSDDPVLHIALEAAPEPHRVRLSFRDNGCGVKSCDLPHLLERGFTGDSGDARRQSTGMGLYLVRQLAEDLNIGLELHSTWLQGFEIALLI